MLTHYPAIKPYDQQIMAVDEPHQLYVEQCGNPDGIPILFVHGGPGGGCSEDNRRYFDPNEFRIILFDQRGSGRSTPHASLENNNTQALVADMETIRKKLGIDRWILFGGSWGSTLSLVYAIHHPDNVRALILRGIFLNRKQDVDWLINGKGANYIFPDHWEEFIKMVDEKKRDNMVDAYYELLTGDDEIKRMAAAKAWSVWEGRCSTLEPNADVVDHFQSPHMALSLSRIECYYFANNCFLEDNFILNNVDKLTDIEGTIIHGRYDMVCSFENAWILHKAWPKSTLKIVRGAGHAASEPGIVDALIHSTREFIE